MFYVAIAILITALALLIFNHEAGQIAGIASEDFARMAMAAALVTVIGSALVFRYRGGLGTALRHALVWIAAGVLLVTGYAYREPLKRLGQTVLSELVPGYAVETRTADGMVEARLKRRADGHFGADVAVNGVSVPMLVDTGASAVTLSHADARRAGFNPEALAFTVQVSTANGRSMAAPVRLDTVSVGSLSVAGLRALVVREGALRESLLGINFLNSIGAYEVRGDVLILRARP